MLLAREAGCEERSEKKHGPCVVLAFRRTESTTSQASVHRLFFSLSAPLLSNKPISFAKTIVFSSCHFADSGLYDSWSPDEDDRRSSRAESQMGLTNQECSATEMHCCRHYILILMMLLTLGNLALAQFCRSSSYFIHTLRWGFYNFDHACVVHFDWTSPIMRTYPETYPQP